MHPKAHLTLLSRMSGCRWVICVFFFFFFNLILFFNFTILYWFWHISKWIRHRYTCVPHPEPSSHLPPWHLYLIFFASVRFIPLLSFIVSIFAWKFPLVSQIFCKRSLVFPILLFFLSLHWSLRKALSSLLAILWNSAFRWLYLSFSPLPFVSFLFSAMCKASSGNHFAFFHFFFLGMVLITASCTMLWTSIHSSSDTLSIRSNPLEPICHFHYIILRDLI